MLAVIAQSGFSKACRSWLEVRGKASKAARSCDCGKCQGVGQIELRGGQHDAGGRTRPRRRHNCGDVEQLHGKGKLKLKVAKWDFVLLVVFSKDKVAGQQIGEQVLPELPISVCRVIGWQASTDPLNVAAAQPPRDFADQVTVKDTIELDFVVFDGNAVGRQQLPVIGVEHFAVGDIGV